MAGAPTTALPEPEARRKPTIEELKRLTETIVHIPRLWAVAVVIGVLVSLFQVTRTASGGYVIDFQATSTTVALVIALWLPSAIQLVAVAGGVLPTPAGQASTPGLSALLDKLDLDPDAHRAALAPLAAAIETSTKANDPGVQEVRRSIESELESLPASQQQARTELQRLADSYRDIRKALPAGARRTSQMTQIAIEARSLAADANFSPDEIRSWLTSDHDGQRLVAIATLERIQDPAYFQDIAEVIDHPRSAFEQYHGLLAVMPLIDRLGPQQRSQLISVLNHQRSGEQGTFISTSDRSRWDVSQAILQQLRG